MKTGWTETRARKVVVTVALLTGLFLIPASRVSSPAAAVALIIGGCLVGLATGNLLVILQACAPPEEIGLWTGVYNFIGNIAGILSPLDHRLPDRADGLLRAGLRARRGAHRAGPARPVVRRRRAEAAARAHVIVHD